MQYTYSNAMHILKWFLLHAKNLVYFGIVNFTTNLAHVCFYSAHKPGSPTSIAGKPVNFSSTHLAFII